MRAVRGGHRAIHCKSGLPHSIALRAFRSYPCPSKHQQSKGSCPHDSINKFMLAVARQLLTSGLFPVLSRWRMQKKLILDSKQLDITLSRLCQQLIENHSNFSNCVLLGLQPRGIFLAELIYQKLKSLKVNVPLGYLDATFHRDDFRRRDTPAKASETRVPFAI